MAGLTIAVGRCSFCGAAASRTSPLVANSTRSARICRACTAAFTRAPRKRVKADHRELRRGADLQTHFDLGIAYREMGLFPEATCEFDIAAASPRLAAEAHCLKGICHRAAGMPQAALSSFLEGIASPKATNRQKARCSY